MSAALSEVSEIEESWIVIDDDEGKLMKEAMQGISHIHNRGPQLDLLEVYAYDTSQLTAIAIANGLHARRFTADDGDLGTRAGKIKLLRMIAIYRPKHIWLAPECSPWCAWNRFNALRSLRGNRSVHMSRNESRNHLKLCSMIARIQVEAGRHVHMENPWGADSWKQPEMQDLLSVTRPAQVDQCQFGLKHPVTRDPMQKRTCVRTTSRAMHTILDNRLCNHDHAHSQIAGSCRVNGVSVSVSKFAAVYIPRL